jgi:hypothetical protein
MTLNLAMVVRRRWDLVPPTLGVRMWTASRPHADTGPLIALPKSPRTAEHTLGLAYLKRGRRDEAVRWLEKAAEVRPDRESIREHLESR